MEAIIADKFLSENIVCYFEVKLCLSKWSVDFKFGIGCNLLKINTWYEKSVEVKSCSFSKIFWSITWCIKNCTLFLLSKLDGIFSNGRKMVLHICRNIWWSLQLQFLTAYYLTSRRLSLVDTKTFKLILSNAIVFVPNHASLLLFFFPDGWSELAYPKNTFAHSVWRIRSRK